MSIQDSHTRQTKRETPLKRIEKLHPFKMLLYLGMIGSSVIFLFMLLAYATTITGSEALPETSLPKPFIVSTVLILINSVCMARALAAYRQEESKILFTFLSFSAGLVLIFGAFQYWGWSELMVQELTLATTQASGYLYIITIIHIAHVLGGAVFLAAMWWMAWHMRRDPVKALIVYTNPYHKMRMELLANYWHFLDLLWLGIFLFFLFTF